MTDGTPILNALIRHVSEGQKPLHVPGHQQGQLLPAAFSAFAGPIPKLDLTELPGLDNLHAPESCILDSSQLTAQLYGAERTWYSVNGSSAGVMAAIASMSGPGQKVLFLNPFHQSAWRGLVLSDALPMLMPPMINEDSHGFDFPSIEQVAKWIQQHPDVRTAFLTSPTYHGNVAPVADYAKLLHEHGIGLIVDEAHGAHLGMHPSLPPNSVQAGADVVVQSVHKMLPGLTQTAWVHAQGARVDLDTLSHWMRFLQSTSPSYVLMASIDAVQDWLRNEAEEAMDRSLPILQAQRETLRALLQGSASVSDPFKLWIPTKALEDSASLVQALAKRRLVPEYSDRFGVLCIYRLNVSRDEVGRVTETVIDWGSRVSKGGQGPTFARWRNGLEAPVFRLPPRAAEFAQKEWVTLEHCAGRMNGQLITPYPPGVPVVFPGQTITEPVQTLLQSALAWGVPVHGLRADGRIQVIE